jgi:hypothetical protein
MYNNPAITHPLSGTFNVVSIRPWLYPENLGLPTSVKTHGKPPYALLPPKIDVIIVPSQSLPWTSQPTLFLYLAKSLFLHQYCPGPSSGTVIPSVRKRQSSHFSPAAPEGFFFQLQSKNPKTLFPKD